MRTEPRVTLAPLHSSKSQDRQIASCKKKVTTAHSTNANARGLVPPRTRTKRTPQGGLQLRIRTRHNSVDEPSPAEALTGDNAPTDYATECQRLRCELERVVADYQRQADEIVALRALARSLKEEVEMMHSTHSPIERSSCDQRSPAQGFFRLDAQVDTLIAENERLEARVRAMEHQNRELTDLLQGEIPRQKILVVQALAESKSLASQLRDEQNENDRLRGELAYYRARGRSPVHVRSQHAANHRGDQCLDQDVGNRPTWNNQHESMHECEESLRESLLSCKLPKSAFTGSDVSSQIECDVDNLRAELRRLHRLIDTSELLAQGSQGIVHSSDEPRDWNE